MEDRYKSKIRKLLALAGSDNPHEAERARVQAAAMMKKHGVAESDLDISEIKSITLPYLNLKASDNLLLCNIVYISGSEAYIKKSRRNRSRSSTIFFMGIKSDAELAAYSYEVLHRQMMDRSKMLKKQNRYLNHGMLERYRHAWVVAASEKLINVFGGRKIPESVRDLYKRKMAGCPQSKPRKPSKGTGLDHELFSLGMYDGAEARLHAAAGDQQEKPLLLESGG